MTGPGDMDGGGGRLAENIMHFARVLRRAGLPLGPGKVIDAIRAVEVAGIRRRDDFYWTLHAVFVNRRDQRDLFDQAFHVFWRNPKLLEKSLSLLLPSVEVPAEDEKKSKPASQRLAEAMFPDRGDRPAKESGEDEVEVDMTLTWSDRERLSGLDFEKMTNAEIAAARQAMARLVMPVATVPTRRMRPDPRGRAVDMRATLRASLRAGGAIALRRKTRRELPPPLVVLCDISGSMSRYSRMLLHFMHALTNDRERVSSFLFGTRLTNITRHLRHKDVDVALGKIGTQVEDWSGGTRIGPALAEFNLKWSRRVLGQGAVVLFISDGLDREGGEGLGTEIERLHKSCRRLIWLNPLLRWSGFEPKSAGIRAILPHVDEFRPVHNLDSLADLAQALSRPAGPRGRHGWENRL